MYQGNTFQLIMRRGPHPNQTYDLNKDVVTLGRDITNDIVINDPEVSRHHMRLTLEGGGYALQDLGSTNGTFVNGERVMNIKSLQSGDMIALGETVTLGYEVVLHGAHQTNADSMTPSPLSQIEGSSTPMPPNSLFYSNYGNDQEMPLYNEDPAYSDTPSQAPRQRQEYYTEYDNVEPDNTFRFILVGCGILFVFACCMFGTAAYLIDANCLWDEIPILSDILSAIGYSVNTDLAECL